MKKNMESSNRREGEEEEQQQHPHPHDTSSSSSTTTNIQANDHQTSLSTNSIKLWHSLKSSSQILTKTFIKHQQKPSSSSSSSSDHSTLIAQSQSKELQSSSNLSKQPIQRSLQDLLISDDHHHHHRLDRLDPDRSSFLDENIITATAATTTTNPLSDPATCSSSSHHHTRPTHTTPIKSFILSKSNAKAPSTTDLSSPNSQALLPARPSSSSPPQSHHHHHHHRTSSSSQSNSILHRSPEFKSPPIESSTDPSKPTPYDLHLSPRKYYILTNAGKPVWSTEHDDDQRQHGDVTSQMALMQAIISIFEDDDDELRYIDAGHVRIAVISRPPLYFLVVSNWGEPESVLRMHLELLNVLVQSILSTTQLKKMFENRPNYDLRRVLSGTESIFNGLIDRLSGDLSIMMSSLSVYRCPPKIRDRISQIITPSSTESSASQDSLQLLDSIAQKLLYSIVVAHGQVVSLVRPKKHSVHPSDLHIIMTTILSSTSIKSSESWIPICLPSYNATGFLHGYINFKPSIEVGLILISGDRDGFYNSKRWAEEIFKDPIWIEFSNLRNLNRLDHHLNHHADRNPTTILPSSPSSPKSTHVQDHHYPSILDPNSTNPSSHPSAPLPCGPYYLEQLSIPGLRHFIYKDKRFVQISYPEWEDDYLIDAHRQRLIVNYQKAFDLIHPSKKNPCTPHHVPNKKSVDDGQKPNQFGKPPPAMREGEEGSRNSWPLLPTPPPPIKFTFFKTRHESILGWITNSYEIYVTVSPLVSKSSSILIVHSIVNWIRTHHRSIFLTTPNQF